MTAPNDLAERARNGDPQAQYELGEANRSSSPPNVPAAMQWYFKSASQNHVPAQLALGLLLIDDLSAIGVKRNPVQASRWLQKAAEAGNSVAQYRLGMLLSKGDGVDQDIAGGLRWLLDATEAGHADARFEAACILALNSQGPADTQKYHQLLIQGAQQDHVPSLNHIAMLMQHGAGFNRDEVAAARIYEYALIKFGDPAAAQSLATLYAKGIGVQADHQMALELLEYAVGAGHDDALYNLGLLRLSAPAVKDLVEAVKWATLSLKYKPEGGAPRMLEVLGGLCTPLQIEEGRARAASWQREPRGLTLVNASKATNPLAGATFTFDPGG